MVLPHFERTFVFIDAIDELELRTRKSLLELMSSISRNTTSLFLTGRPHIRIEVSTNFQAFTKSASPAAFDIVASEDDIRTYLTSKINKDGPFPHLMDNQLQALVLDTLVPRAKGMYVYQGPFEGNIY